MTGLSGLWETGEGAHLPGSPALPAPPHRPTCVRNHVPRLPSLPASRRSLPEVAPSHAQSPPTAGDVKLSSYHCCASASRRGRAPGSLNKSCRFRAHNQYKGGFLSWGGRRPRTRVSKVWQARGWLSGGHPRIGLSPLRNLCHLVPPRPTTVFRPFFLVIDVVVLVSAAAPTTGARTQAGAAGWRGGGGCGCSSCDGCGGCSGDCGGGRGPAAGGGAEWLCAGRRQAPRRCLASWSCTSSPFLSASDRLRASASCSHWRGALFYPGSLAPDRICLRVSPRATTLNSSCASAAGSCESCVLNSPRRTTWAAAAARRWRQRGRRDWRGKKSKPCGSPTRWLEVLRTYLELVLCVLVSIAGTTGRLFATPPFLLLPTPASTSRGAQGRLLPHLEIDSVANPPASALLFSVTRGVSSNPEISLRREDITGLIPQYFINSDGLGVYQTALLAPSRHCLIHPWTAAVGWSWQARSFILQMRAEAWRVRPENESEGRNKTNLCFCCYCFILNLSDQNSSWWRRE